MVRYLRILELIEAVKLSTSLPRVESVSLSGICYHRESTCVSNQLIELTESHKISYEAEQT